MVQRKNSGIRKSQAVKERKKKKKTLIVELRGKKKKESETKGKER